MVKTKIGVDIDGVISTDFSMSIDMLNAHFGTSFHTNEVDDYYFENFYERHGFSKEEARSLLDEAFHSSEFLSKSAVILPMLTTLKRLSGMSSDPSGVTIITARPEVTKTATKQYIDDHGISYHSIVHTSDKRSYCREKGIRYMIEDSPRQAEECSSIGVGVLLIDYPYNRSVHATGKNGIWRIEHPSEIPQIIEKDIHERS